MKKLFLLLTALVFALAFGVAFAEESVPYAKDMSGPAWYNGITVFETTGPDCSLDMGGSGAGGLSAEEASRPMNNGITFFDSGRAASGARGACVGGADLSESSKDNGITIFDTGSVEAN